MEGLKKVKVKSKLIQVELSRVKLKRFKLDWVAKWREEKVEVKGKKNFLLFFVSSFPLLFVLFSYRTSSTTFYSFPSSFSTLSADVFSVLPLFTYNNYFYYHFFSYFCHIFLFPLPFSSCFPFLLLFFLFWMVSFIVCSIIIVTRAL